LNIYDNKLYNVNILINMENLLTKQKLCVICLKNNCETQIISFINDIRAVCCSTCVNLFFGRKPYSSDFDLDEFIMFSSNKK